MSTASTNSTAKPKRSFKLIFPVKGGRYIGRSPKQAATKAFTYLTKQGAQYGGGKNVEFKIQESTQGSNHVISIYRGSKHKLDVPIKAVIKGKPVEYKFKNNIKKVGIVKPKETTKTVTPKSKPKKSQTGKVTEVRAKRKKASTKRKSAPKKRVSKKKPSTKKKSTPKKRTSTKRKSATKKRTSTKQKSAPKRRASKKK